MRSIFAARQLGVHGGIVDRELVVDGFLIDVVKRSITVFVVRGVDAEEGVKGMEISGLDHERITLPATPGITHLRTHVIGRRSFL